MLSAPTGTVTFLFTDIEGSTTLAQAQPAEWEIARQRHLANLRCAAQAEGAAMALDQGIAYALESQIE